MIHLELDDIDAMYASLNKKPLTLNDLHIQTDLERGTLEAVILTKYTESQKYIMVPSCNCGETTGYHNVHTLCPICNCVVANPDEDVEPSIWYMKPEGISKLVNPQAWGFIRDRLMKSKVDVLEWLTNTRVTFNGAEPGVITNIKKLGIPRGYNHFVENLYTIVPQILNTRDYSHSIASTTAVKTVIEVLHAQRDRVFCTMLPFPNKLFMIMEYTSRGCYVDKNLKSIIDPLYLLLNKDMVLNGSTKVKVLENRMSNLYSKLTIFYKSTYESLLASKYGLIRKHITGSRSPLSFRNVITSITTAHDYDTIHIPWCVGVTVLRPYIVNKLTKKGWNITDIINYTYAHVYQYSELLDNIFKELIAESPDGGLPADMTRNPSLTAGSTVMVRITKVKTDPQDYTMSVSIITVSASNADFDGDAVNCFLTVDRYLTDKLRDLRYHNYILDGFTPRKISKNLTMPKPLVNNVANWLSRR